METSGDLCTRKKIEELVGRLICPKAVKCYQFAHETFAEAQQIGGALWLFECLDEDPVKCTFAQFFAQAGSYICTCAVRTYVAGKMRTTNKLAVDLSSAQCNR
jgi:hypothetical protein